MSQPVPSHPCRCGRNADAGNRDDPPSTTASWDAAPRLGCLSAGRLPTHWRLVLPIVGDLIAEAAQMPDAAIRFARGVGSVWTPEHLVPLRTRVRQQHATQLRGLHAALDKRFSQPNADWMGVFRAAAEMALMEQIARKELKPEDRLLLRQLWLALLEAK